MAIRLMGIVNTTPDSFSDGGQFEDPNIAVDHAMSLVKSGAAIVDVGGESTRPESRPVSEEEELRRVLPVLQRLDGGSVAISVDTAKAAVAAAALDAGARIVNDVTALRGDPELAAMCADRGPVVVLMHAPKDWPTPRPPSYDDVVDEVKAGLAERVEAALAAGIAEEKIWLDPGIGFGKSNPEGNLTLLRRLDELEEFGRPILVGPSRKTFIGRLDGSPPQDRLGGTVAACLIAAANGAAILRVHDVAAVAQALQLTAAALEDPRFAVLRRGLP